MKRPLAALAVPAVLACALAASSPEEALSQQENQSGFEREVITRGLNQPWDLDFFPNGDALVSERDSGDLLRVERSGEVRKIQSLPANGQGEGGLLGVALSPYFKENRLVYAYYSTPQDNRVARFRIGERPRPIFTGIPVSSRHDGGRIEFHPSGSKLFVATGDANRENAAQNRNSLAGKILRLNPDGSVPGNNPFDNAVFSLGHRNVQGLSWDGKGRLYASELGATRYDEINRILRGENYGWPEVEGRGGEPRYEDPLTVFRPANASPSGIAFGKGSGSAAVAGWNGDLFMAALRGERLWRMERDGNGNITDRHQILKGVYGRLRHVEQAPDGSLWLLTANGGDADRVVRISSR